MQIHWMIPTIVVVAAILNVVLIIGICNSIMQIDKIIKELCFGCIAMGKSLKHMQKANQLAMESNRDLVIAIGNFLDKSATSSNSKSSREVTH